MATRRLSPTALAAASQCLHTWTLECFGDPAEKLAPDAGRLLLFERGHEYEREVVATLPSKVEPVWDGKAWEAGHAATLELMREGHPWIYQGVLVRGTLRGKPDLLQRIEQVRRRRGRWWR